MIKLAILICFLGAESLTGSKCEDTVRYQFMLPDSFFNRRELQKLLDNAQVMQAYVCEIIERSKELVEKSREFRKEMEYLDYEKMEKICEDFDRNLKRNLIAPRVEIISGAVFNDTGLIRSGVKYFIRIWKHPPKEKFNMPTFKLR